jgi:hypothetical protein
VTEVVVLAWLFVEPLRIPSAARLWMILPLLVCVATVYRVTRARTAADLPRRTVLTFVNILVGMLAIAAGFYALHQFVLRVF